MAHYIHDDKNNRIEGMSKEEIYALLAAAIQSGELPSVEDDTAFVTMIKSIVDGQAYKIGFCTEAQYQELRTAGELVENAFYIITDDTTYQDLETYLENLTAEDNQLNASVVSLNGDIDSINERLDAMGFKEGTLYFEAEATAGSYTYTLEGTLTKETYYATVAATLTVTFTVSDFDIVHFKVKVSNDFIPVSDHRVVGSTGYVFDLDILYENETATTETKTITKSVNKTYKLT